MSNFKSMKDLEKQFIANVYKAIKEDKDFATDIEEYLEPKKVVPYIRYGTPEQAQQTEEAFRKKVRELFNTGYEDIAYMLIEEREKENQKNKK